ncbi:MAG: hypothetical protein RQ745_02665 [Longimicrobiales bacterium]|nr:hypothetical protein [Longimicrobiales bacterium]
MTPSITESPGPGLPTELPPPARDLAETVIAATGEELSAILLYGSQLLRAEPDLHSAWDLVLVVERYQPFHRALVASGLHRGPAWLLDLMGQILPPSVTALQAANSEAIGKCVIVSRGHFERGLLPGAPDHFLKGRLIQKVALVWARDATTTTAIERWIRVARRDVLSWIASDIVEPFDASAAALRILEVSYAGELRPEDSGRVREVHAAQEAWLEEAFAEVLREAAAEGELVVDRSGGYRFAHPPGVGQRLRRRLYFVRSKARATLRWLKYVLTFDGWLTYLVRKVERRTGEAVELTPLEARYPLIFLWPRAIRFLLDPARRKGPM